MSLHGRLVLVVARMPPDRGDAIVERDMSNDWVETEEALSSVVRAVVEAGGRVALLGDATSTLLAVMVTAEYLEPQEAEGPERAPAQLIIASATVEEERAHEFGAGLGIAEISSAGIRELAPRADALICLGSTNLREDIGAFRHANQSAPIFAFARTGGGAQALRDSPLAQNVSFADLEAEQFRPAPQARDDRSPSDEEERNREFEFPPFALAAQIIVETLERR
jgi:hypothetical protein